MPTLFRQLQQARDHEPPAPASPVTDRSSSKSSSSSRRGSRSSQARMEVRKEFLRATSKCTRDEVYTNPESLPSLDDAYNNFQRIYPKFSETWVVDDLRDREYSHLVEGEHVCMDYCGFGLFSYDQQVISKASSSFGLAYISANLPTHALYGAAEEGTAEAYIRKRVMDYLNVSDQEYSMVFTASRGSAFKLLAESYPFHLNRRLLTVYDFESEAVKWMAESAKQKGAKIMRACFKWPSLRVSTTELKKQLQVKRKKGDSAKGLFVFPVQSRMTGAKYSYQWMSIAQQNRWHVLLDASALGPKDMDSLGLSLFRPDFIVSSFYKVFGTDPTGFGCLFIKNSAVQSLHNSSRARAVGMVRIVSINPTDGPEGREAEDDEEFERSAWRLDQQVGMSSFSGPVSSFYSEVESKKLKSPVSRENKYRARSKLPARSGKRAGEIDNSGYLGSVGEIQEEGFDEDGGSGRFSGRLSGYHSHPRGEIGEMSETEYSGQLTGSRYDFGFEGTGSAREIEEVVSKSGSLTRPRSSFGSSSGDIEEVTEKRHRKSLREQLHEPEISPVRIMSSVLQEENDTPTSSARYHTVPHRRSYRMEDEDDDVPHTSVMNDRRAGDADESPSEEYEDYRNSNYSFRNGMSRDQYDDSPDDIMYSAAASEDRFESHFERETTSQIEEEIEEREFSRTALSDIEEEKGEGEDEDEDEGGDLWMETDDDRKTEQMSTAEATDEGILYPGEHQTGVHRAQASDDEGSERNLEGRTDVKPRPEVLTETIKVEQQAVAQKQTRIVEGIRARFARFVSRATFRRHSGKETSDSQGRVNKSQSLPTSSQFEEFEGALEPKSDLPLQKRRGSIIQPDSFTYTVSPAPGGTISEVRNDRNAEVGGAASSPGLPTPEKFSKFARQASGSDSDDGPVPYKEPACLGFEGTSSEATKMVPPLSNHTEEGDTEMMEQHSREKSSLMPNGANDVPPSRFQDDAVLTRKDDKKGTPDRVQDMSFSESDIRKNQTEDDEALWTRQEDLRRSGRWGRDQAGPASASQDSVDDDFKPRPREGDNTSQSASAAARGLQNAHLFRADGGGTPYESGEENYITILPGNRSGKSLNRIPEPVNGSPDFARQQDSKSPAEDLPNTPSPAVERGMEQRHNSAVSPAEAAESPKVRERPRSSGLDDLGELPDSSYESPRGEYDGKDVAVSTPLHSKATPHSSASTPNNATSSYQTERVNTEDLSFDEAEFHDAEDQRGINGFSQDLRSGRPLSRDVEIDDDMFISSRRRHTLAEDLARIDLEDSDDDSYYRAQYYRDSYHGSSSPRYFGDDVSPSARHQREGSDDDFEEGENGDLRQPRILCKGLDLADSLGLTKTNYRLRYLINWLVNSLLKLHHPSPDNRGISLVRIYGPKVKYDRGAAVAFNLFDWKGVFIQPGLVQRLADRSNVSLGVGRLCNIVDPDLSPDFLAEKERWYGSENDDHGKEGTRYCTGRSDGRRSSSAGKWESLSIPVVTAALGFVTNFEDVYRLWAFVAKFLDADFVSKEVWRYHSLNQQTVVV